MKTVTIFYWMLSAYPNLLALGLEHNSVHELPENEVGLLVQNIAEFGYYVALKKRVDAETDYIIYIDEKRFGQR